MLVMHHQIMIILQIAVLISNLLAIYKKIKNIHIWIGQDFNLPDVDLISNNIIGHQYPNKFFLGVFKQAEVTANSRIQCM